MIVYRGLVEQELPPEEIAAALGWTPDKVNLAADRLTAMTRDFIESATPADHYTGFVLRSNGLIRRALGIYDNSGNAIARVQALSLAATLQERQLKVGQDLGLIERAPKKVLVAGAIVLSDLPREELRKFLGQQAEQAGRLTRPAPLPLLLDEVEDPAPGEPS